MERFTGALILAPALRHSVDEHEIIYAWELRRDHKEPTEATPQEKETGPQKFSALIANPPGFLIENPRLERHVND